MASYTTRVKGVRLKNATDDYFKDKPLNKMVESLKDLLEAGKIDFDGEEIIICNGVNTPSLSPAGDELLSMLNCFKKSESEFLDDVTKLMNDGSLTYENGKLIAVSTPNLGDYHDKFLEWCSKKKADPQKVLDNIMERVAKEVGF